MKTLIEIYREQKNKGVLLPYKVIYNEKEYLLVYANEDIANGFKLAFVIKDQNGIHFRSGRYPGWSLPKKKYARYRFNRHADTSWTDTGKYFATDADFLTDKNSGYGDNIKNYERLLYTEFEAE